MGGIHSKETPKLHTEYMETEQGMLGEVGAGARSMRTEFCMQEFWKWTNY